MKKITRDEMELEVFRYFSQTKLDVFSREAEGLDKRNYQRIIFPQLEQYETMGIRHIFRLVGTDKLLHEYPSDWWQAFKERWLPRWILKISPARQSEVVARHLFPYLQEELGDEIVKVYTKKKEVK